MSSRPDRQISRQIMSSETHRGLRTETLVFTILAATILLVSVAFVVWDISQDRARTVTDYHARVHSLAAAFQGYVDSLLTQSELSLQGVWDEASDLPAADRGKPENIVAILKHAMLYDPASAYLYARYPGKIYAVNRARLLVNSANAENTISAALSLHEDTVFSVSKTFYLDDEPVFLLRSFAANPSEGVLELGAVVPISAFRSLDNRMGELRERELGVIRSDGTILFRAPFLHIGESVYGLDDFYDPELGGKSPSPGAEAHIMSSSSSTAFPVSSYVTVAESVYLGGWWNRFSARGLLLLAIVALLATAYWLNRRIFGNLSRSEGFYRGLFANINDGIFVMRGSAIVACNPIAAGIFGARTPEEMLGLCPPDLSPKFQPDGRESSAAGALIIDRVNAGAQLEFDWVHKKLRTEQEIYCRVRLSPLGPSSDRLLLSVIHDISEEKQVLETQQYLANHDALTQLPNRYWFSRILIRQVEESFGKRFAVAIMDLNRFKEINDTLGHGVGDEVLRLMGQRLVSWAAEKQVLVARLGGDEIAFLIPEGSDEIYLNGFGEALSVHIKQPLALEGLKLELGASIGMAFYPDHARDADGLLRCADIAMYVAKRARNDFAIFSPERDIFSPQRLALHGELSRAIRNQQLTLYYQPKVNLKDGTVHGFEALVRWIHSERGLIPPGDFIPIAENTELIRPLTTWVLNQAVRQAAEWFDKANPAVVAINISSRNLVDADFVKTVAAALERHKLPPALLELEVTESALMEDPNLALERLTAVRELGVSIAIDDFGTGYSSFAYLKRLPIQVLKVDRTFVSGLISNDADAKIVAAVIKLAHDFGLEVVAEGAESMEIIEVLRSLDCNMVQGYVVSKPLPHEDAENWRHNFDRRRFLSAKV